MEEDLPVSSRAEVFDEFKDPLITDWKRVRSCIEREDDLIDQRLRWLLTSQGFLFTAFAAALAAITSEKVDPKTQLLAQLLIGSLAIMALAICLMVYSKISAAEDHLSRLRRYWKWRCQSDPDFDRHPPIMGWSRMRLNRWMPFRSLPLFFGLGWILFISFALGMDFFLAHARELGRYFLWAAGVMAVIFVSFALGRVSKKLNQLDSGAMADMELEYQPPGDSRAFEPKPRKAGNRDAAGGGRQRVDQD
jgi:hypothetical protein